MKYSVQYTTWASCVIKVDADNPADAREKASAAFQEEGPGGLCHHCAQQIDLGDDWEQEEFEDGVWES
jgi:hypothetical protein